MISIVFRIVNCSTGRLIKSLVKVKLRGIAVSPIRTFEAANPKKKKILIKKRIKAKKNIRNHLTYTNSITIAPKKELQTFENIVLIREGGQMSKILLLPFR